MNIRKLSAQEIAEFCDGDRYAYAPWLNAKPEPEWIAVIDPDQVLAAFVDGKMVAALTCHRFEQIVGRQIKKMGGIGGVWTYPEYRDRGYVRALMGQAFAEMYGRGDAVSMLLPFKQSFYQKFGYTSANANTKLTIPLTGLAHHLQAQSDRFTIQRCPTLNLPADLQIEIGAFIRELVRKNSNSRWHGYVFTNLAPAAWQWQYRNTVTVSVRQDQQLQAIAIYSITCPIGEAKSTIQVKEIYWASLGARDMLLRYFASHRDQLEHICLELPMGENFYAWFQDLPDSAATKINPHPWMVRVINLPGAIAGIRSAVAGKITIQVKDAQCVWNNQTFELIGNGNTLSASVSLKPAQICLDISACSALIYGTMAIAELEHGQLIDFGDLNYETLNQIQTTLTAWFPSRTLFNPTYY